MTRNLKALGLALAAVFAMSSVAVSAASADEFKAEKTPVTLTGKQVTPPGDVFTVDGGEVKCTTATYHGTQSAASSSSLTVKPTYSGCTFAGVVPVTIDMNTCDYLFTIEAGVLKTKGWVDIVCTTKGDSITVTVNPAAHGLTEKCLIHIGEQTIGGITYKNVGALATREVEVEVSTGKTILYSQTEGTGLGHCETKDNTNNGTYVGKALVTGETDLTKKQEEEGVKPTHIGVFVE